MKHYHKNPRQITKKQFADLQDSLRRLGDLSGIVHDLTSDEIIGGNQRMDVFDLKTCQIELTDKLDQPDAQGTVARGFVIWQGNRYTYRAVMWDDRTREEANIRANKAGGSWDMDMLANQFELPDLLEWGFSEIELGLGEDEADKPHVTQNTGNNEWYTPTEYIEAAREVMGGFDLDPASSVLANTVVRAKQFYTFEDNGLEKPWYGRVWMNPPYSDDLIGKFVERLASFQESGDVSESVVLINNATETAWFNRLISVATAVCFPRNRVKFWQPSGDTGSPLQGQAIVYTGKDTEKFSNSFFCFGWVALVNKFDPTTQTPELIG